jgi:hypothetical protein
MKFARNALFVAAAVCRHQSVIAFAPGPVARNAQHFGPHTFVPDEYSSTSVAGVRTFLRRTFGSSTVSPAGPDITEDEVRALFSLWNNALATGDSRIVAKRYAKEPVLLPTVSDVPRTDFEGLKDYFDGFLLKEPQGKILEGDIRIGDGWCQDAGIYEVRCLSLISQYVHIWYFACILVLIFFIPLHA